VSNSCFVAIGAVTNYLKYPDGDVAITVNSVSYSARSALLFSAIGAVRGIGFARRHQPDFELSSLA
jgi:hypothetical protein